MRICQHDVTGYHRVLHLQEFGDLLGSCRDPVSLLSRSSTHTCARDACGTTQGSEAKEQTGMRVPTPRAEDYLIEVRSARFHLLQELLGRQDITQRAQRRMPRSQMNDVRSAPLVTQLCRNGFELPIGSRLILAIVIVVNPCPEEMIEKHIARARIEVVITSNSLLELHMALHAETVTRRNGRPDKVGLNRAGDQQRVCILGERVTEVELQLTDLVAAHRQAGEVISLHQQLGAPHVSREVGHRLQWRGQVSEPGPGHLGKLRWQCRQRWHGSHPFSSCVSLQSPRSLAMFPEATTDIEQAKQDLDTHGFCRIPRALSGDALAEARERLVEQSAGEERAGVDFRDGGATQAILDDFGQLKPDAFSTANGGINQRLWLLVDELVGHILGSRFLLSTHSANIAKPGGGRMGLHTDQWWMPQPVSAGNDYVRPSEISRVPSASAIAPDPGLGICPPVVANTMWMLSDFTEENGATEVVPGSHLSGAQPHPAEQSDYDIGRLVGEAGSLAVFDGRLWHGTGAHVGGEDRLGVLGTFCAPQFRQQENQVHGLDRKLWPDLSDKMKERLGFKPWNTYGRLENPAAPWIEPIPELVPELR